MSLPFRELSTWKRLSLWEDMPELKSSLRVNRTKLDFWSTGTALRGVRLERAGKAGFYSVSGSKRSGNLPLD
jgi:hypothetical protein